MQIRRKVYDRVVAEKALISGFHWSFPAVGHVEKEGNGYRMVPAAWSLRPILVSVCFFG